MKNFLPALLQCPACRQALVAYRCPGCERTYLERDGTIFFRQVPAQESASGRTDISDTRLWTPLRRAQFQYYEKRLAQLQADSVILDLGAGEGKFSSLFKRFSHYIAMDFAPYPGIDVVADLRGAIPLRDGSVDLIVSANSFEHIPVSPLILAECSRVLKPGGLLLVAVPFLSGVHQAPYDFVRHTHLYYQELLTDAGFILTEMLPAGSVYAVQRTMRDKAFQYLYQATPSSSYWLNQIWRIWAKGYHRLWKFMDRIGYNVFFRYAPSTLDFTEGYLFTAKKQS